MNTENVLALADFIERTPGPVNYNLSFCIMGWTSFFDKGDRHYHGGIGAAKFLGIDYNVYEDITGDDGNLAFFGWPKDMREEVQPNVYPDVRDRVIRNLRHWASVGRVEWIA